MCKLEKTNEKINLCSTLKNTKKKKKKNWINKNVYLLYLILAEVIFIPGFKI